MKADEQLHRSAELQLCANLPLSRRAGALRSAEGGLRSLLSQVHSRQRRLMLWRAIGSSWGALALLALAMLLVERQSGWGTWIAAPVLIAAMLASVVLIIIRRFRAAPDWTRLAQQIETQFPRLDGRLLTAVQLHASPGSGLNYLQQRVVEEALICSTQDNWPELVPRSQIKLAQAGVWVSLVVFGVAIFSLPKTESHALVARITDFTVTVSPGDTSVEKGSSVVIFARFGKILPPGVDLILEQAAGQKRMPLAKSLADPVFGASIPEVSANLRYHLEYAGQRTRTFAVTVFEYPRLERADAKLTFPEYTALAPKRIENTKRLSAVEGSRIDLALQLNKPVRSAQLIAKNKDDPSVIALKIETNRPAAFLNAFPLVASKSYELQLIDEDGRTNKTKADFVFAALKNQPPELKLASPHGDLRPSALEEITFEGTVWDDYGVEAYGFAYGLPGEDARLVKLGSKVPAGQKSSFKYVFRMEDLGIQPDQVVAWFTWADDKGPDGQIRRTVGDMYFAEVRPFDEIFREGQGGGGGGGAQGGGGGQSGSTRLLELQKKIISATWNLQRQYGGPMRADQMKVPDGDSSKKLQPIKPRQSRLDAPRPMTHVTETHEETLGRSLPSLAQNPLSRSDSYAPTSRVAQNAAIHPVLFGQVSGESPLTPQPSSRRGARSSSPPQSKGHTYQEDATILYESMAQALEEAEAAAEGQRDPRGEALWNATVTEMKKALEVLARATNSPKPLPEAVVAEQSAYQALVKLQEHEYEVSRRNRNQGQGGGSERMQRQLEQMEMTQSENRYETQRQAQRPQNTQAREQLQILNRLQELARRQQDLNDRLKELQTALQEAKTEQERDEIRRRLKRLQEEEQQMLSEVDEVRQRMDRPENQSRMAEERKQLEQTREDVQRAAEASSQGSASQALAAGTRAQRQLQDLRDQMRKNSSNQFADDLRDMRAEARELSRQQEDILKKLNPDSAQDNGPKPLTDAPEREQLMNKLAHQKERLTNLVDRATAISQEAETAEPLLSRELYDSLRKFSQDNLKNMKQAEEELVTRGLMSESRHEQLKQSPDSDAAKLLDMTSELISKDARRQASDTAQKSKGAIDDLKRGVERAAESVLGDDTEALRLAQEQLTKLAEDLQREMSQASTNGLQSGTGSEQTTRKDGNQSEGTQPSDNGQQASDSNQPGNESKQTVKRKGNSSGEQPANANERQEGGAVSSNEAGQPGSGQKAGDQKAQTSPGQGSQPGGQQDGNSTSQSASTGRNQPGQPNSNQANDGRAQTNRRAGGARPGGNAAGWGNDWGADWLNNFNRGSDDGSWQGGPLTGGDFGPWSDHLREVEEILEFPDLRNQVAIARERTRLMRQDFKRDQKKPDWAVVRLQVIKPLLEVRDRVADELARRGSNDALVPIDRDPVPAKYSELVRRYYEELGKNKESGEKTAK